jgi:Fur family ferric uptake transcriptional regulator
VTITVLNKVVENGYHHVMSSWTDEAHSRLQGGGQRMGAARAAVIDYLAEQDCCRGAQEIHEALAARGSTVGLASVYRAVDGLVERGLLLRVDFGDGIARFEPVRSGHEHHHHLVCAECGKVEAFHDAPLERAIEAIERQTGYNVVSHDVVLRGSCADCKHAVQG